MEFLFGTLEEIANQVLKFCGFRIKKTDIFRYGMDRLVEDLIQESMAKGDFDNLSGKGKPLTKKQDHHNPYVDLVTHKLNQVHL